MGYNSEEYNMYRKHYYSNITSISEVHWLLPVQLIPANILMDLTAKKLVDSVICVILYQEVQIVQNAQRFAILVSINVAVYVKLVKPDVQYKILHHHQSQKKLSCFLCFSVIIKILMLKYNFRWWSHHLFFNVLTKSIAWIVSWYLTFLICKI